MQQRKRDLAILIVLDILAFAIGNVLAHRSLSIPPFITVPLMVTTLIGLQYLLYRVTATYAKTRTFRIFYAVLLVVQFILNVYTNRDIPVNEIVRIAIVAYTLSLLVFCIMFYFIVQDMFANKHEGTYSLLAATAAIFTLIAVFGYLYSLIAVNDPTFVGVENPTGQEMIQRTFLMSHYVVAGFDVPGFTAEVLRNAAVVEAISANLFIIFVVGKLMANQK